MRHRDDTRAPPNDRSARRAKRSGRIAALPRSLSGRTARLARRRAGPRCGRRPELRVRHRTLAMGRPTAIIEVTVPTTAGHVKRDGIVVHRQRLPPELVTIHDGIPVTTP